MRYRVLDLNAPAEEEPAAMASLELATAYADLLGHVHYLIFDNERLVLR